MAKKNAWIITVVLVFLVMLSACGPKPEQTNADGKLTVTVSILPQQYFVNRIGGEYVSVNVMVGPGDNPHTYEPKPEQMIALSNSAVYFSIGVEFEEAWLDKISSTNPDMLMVDLIANIDRIPMVAHSHEEEHEGEDHEHEGEDHEHEGEYYEHEGEDHDHEGEEHHHEENGLDPHVWTSPELVKLMSQTIFETLVGLDPEHQSEYAANLAAFISEIDDLENDIRESLIGLEGMKFFVFHPAWGYFANDFGLVQVPIEIGGTEPSASEMAAMIDEAKREGAKIIFVQPEFSTRSAETIASEIGGSVVPISPLNPEWMMNLRNVADAFKQALEK